jgi:tellurite resistance protein
MNITPLKFLAPGWFSVVMGLAGLALAWNSATPALGDSATGVSLVLAAMAWLVFLVLLGLSVVRSQVHGAALTEDMRHPVRHGFVAALPVALLLLVTLMVSFGVREAWVDVLWWVGSLGQLWATVWVLKRWLVASPVPAAAPVALQGLIQGALMTPSAPTAAPAFWPQVTPVLFIPVVGNVVAPLAGLVLGHSVWAMAQFGAGLLLWPVVLGLLLVRRAVQGPLPDRLLPSWFITIAPPSVVGLVVLQLQAPGALVAGFWGVGVFSLLWVGSIAKQAVTQPFALTFWAASFPLAAFTSLTLKIAAQVQSSAMEMAGTLLLALTSLVIFGLVLATVRGLRDGTLLAPEPVANIVPTSA